MCPCCATFHFLFNELKKLVNLACVIAAFSTGWLTESHIADILWSKSASRRISQGCLNDVEKRVKLIFVVTAFSNGWLRESHVADVLWS